MSSENQNLTQFPAKQEVIENISLLLLIITNNILKNGIIPLFQTKHIFLCQMSGISMV